MIHVFELDVLWHLRVGVWKQSERIQSTVSDVANFRPWRHANPKQQLIDLDAELETCASGVSLRPSEHVAINSGKGFRQRRSDSRYFCFCYINPNAVRQLFPRNFCRHSFWKRPRKNFSVIWPGIKLRLGWGLGR